MKEVRRVKINLISLIEELVLSLIDKDLDRTEELKLSFEKVYDDQCVELKRQIISYVITNRSVIENKKLHSYFNKFVSLK